ncbi:MAG: hypothetical protein CMP23_12070 [Rickettsiales bacterium]|nr:hypothetical protein [Rickettsiales bacterium]|tara:strand:- start:3140 stop:4018 length:879 start_codon:yes stop_codon:yes gene_type:complete
MSEEEDSAEAGVNGTPSPDPVDHETETPAAESQAALEEQARSGNLAEDSGTEDEWRPSTSSTSSDAPQTQLQQTPWERRSELGWPSAIWETIAAVSKSPVRFFHSFDPAGRIGEAAGFAFLIAIPGCLIGAAMQFVLGGVTAMLPSMGIDHPLLQQGGDASQQLLSTGIQAAFILFMGAPLAVLGSIIGGCIHHLGLVIVGGGSKGLEATVKGSLYASAVRFWAIIPVLGWLTDLWMTVVQAIAYCQTHKDPGWKGAFAVLYATCICLFCLCGMGIAAAVMMGGIEELPSLF